MSQADTKRNFFRQSGWLMAANLLCGMCMAFVHPFAIRMHPETDYPVFMTMLRIFVIVTIPAAALQTVFAQQVAAAITPERELEVAAIGRGTIKYAGIIWLILLIAAAIFRSSFVKAFQVSNPLLLWPLMFLILMAFWLPIVQGILQGMQEFFLLGWSMILNGVGRVGAIIIAIELFQSGAAGATTAAFIGLLSAVLLAAWPARKLLSKAGGQPDWKSFKIKALPIMVAVGSPVCLINVDMPLVQSHISKEWTIYYSAAEAIGIALVTLCIPIVSVMFPKIVRSRAMGSSSDALLLGVGLTGVVAILAALVCTIFPKLPLQIMFFTKPDMIKAHVLIPWFMWAMVPVTMFNLLINGLVARERHGILPIAILLPIAYSATLYFFLERTTLPPFDTFKRVIQILMAFSSALLAASVYFSLRASSSDAAASRSPATSATP